ncbi:flippase-like domain-containing protein [Catenulispora sp. NL8]|uniref:Flippase-like domain-containing protein n=1 Tax=Catenulispora pinistramenti TaxID=2705254 RepID=A0ABS5KLF1_9ACTN|nr:lysylphosphatidylglycerol synthase domain-containing protein [Catenulispora pinistramenti]MBS2546872.1 flippase-like domain-containing protein [Catenulispora pinistramenti]
MVSHSSGSAYGRRAGDGESAGAESLADATGAPAADPGGAEGASAQRQAPPATPSADGAPANAERSAGVMTSTPAKAEPPAGVAISASAKATAAAGSNAAGSNAAGSNAAGSNAAGGSNVVAGADTDTVTVTEADLEADLEAPLRPAPNRRSQLFRLAFLLLTLAAGAYAVAHQWTRVRTGFADLGPVPLLVALLPALASVGAMMLAWRGLLGALGSPLRLRPASRIFFTSQLGKYLPGSVWPVVAQMQLGRAYRIPRARSAAAAALAMLVSLASALVLAAVALPLGGGAKAAGYWWAFIVVPVLLAGLHPRIANPALRMLFRLTRRPAIEPLTGRTIAETAGRSVVGWLLAGAHIWILAMALGASPWRALLLGIGGYAFAWSVGFLIVFAPAGAGVRELILVAALQPVLDPAKATVVALASRLVTIVADLVAAAVTAREGSRGKKADEASSEAPAEAAV